MTNINITEEQAKRFAEICSHAGRIAFYAVSVSKRRNTGFDRTEMNKEVYTSSSDYFYGFIIALAALGFISFNIKGLVMTIVDINPLMEKAIIDVLNEKAKSDTFVKADMEKIDNYFK